MNDITHQYTAVRVKKKKKKKNKEKKKKEVCCAYLTRVRMLVLCV